MITIASSTIYLILAIITLVGTIFTIFFYFQKPQIALEKRVSSLEDDMNSVNKDITNIQQNHSDSDNALKAELKELTTAVTELGKTVVRLSTIIDERIPKGTPSLTPPGQ